jgi:PAS domain S-box-containing protein
MKNIKTLKNNKNINELYYPTNDWFQDFTKSYLNIFEEKKQNTTYLLENRVKNTKLWIKINIDKDFILDLWIKTNKINQFINKFKVSESEKNYYIKFFWEKVINFLIYNFWEDKNVLDEKHVFLTTKFFDYIKSKNVWIDDLLKIIIILKNIIIENWNYNNYIINEITLIFDLISIILSKEYNSTIIKLLNEHKNAIDKSNIIAKINVWWDIVYVNDEFCNLSLYTKNELIWKKYEDFFCIKLKNFLTNLNNKEMWKWIIKCKKKNDSFYWLKSTIIPILDENNNVLEHICIMTDITDIEITKEHLRESELKHRSFIENVPIWIFRVKQEWNFILINNALVKIFWYSSAEEMIKINIKTLYNDLKDREYLISEIIQWKSIRSYEMKMKKKDWSIIWISISTRAIFVNWKVSYFDSTMEDITMRKKMEEEIKNAYEELKELDIKKDEFLNIASHELRTPMTSIRWYLSMILDGDVWEINENVKSYLEKVYNNSNRLLNLINDMLDISKLEADKQNFSIENINIKKLLTEVYDEMEQLFINKKQEFILDSQFDW